MFASAGGQAILTFAIDLACLASRREYLKLDKWMLDNMSSNWEIFMRACLNFLSIKVITVPLSSPLIYHRYRQNNSIGV